MHIYISNTYYVFFVVVIYTGTTEIIKCEPIFVKYGWRPGAISKRLLRALIKAKQRRFVIEEKQTKKSKKRVEEKPALIISSKGGEYRIEMNAPPGSNGVKSTPLIYSIQSANNKAKIEKKERKQRRLIRAAIDSVWSDHYRPENCENICLPAYNRAIGVKEDTVFQDIEEVDVTSCFSDEELGSSCSSSDIEWELHFSPPSILQKNVPESLRT